MSHEPKKVIVGEPISASDFGRMIQAIQKKMALGVPLKEACDPFLPEKEAVTIEEAAGEIAEIIKKEVDK